MRTTPWEKNIPEINTKGINSFKDTYLKKVGESSIESLSLPKAEKLFASVIKDFKVGILSSDELADFGEILFHEVAKRHPKSDLFEASLSASELTFALRSKAVYKNLQMYLNDIDKFYEADKLQI